MKALHLLLAALFLALTPLARAAQPATKPALTLELAKEIAAKAAAEARKNNWNVVIAIVDDGANLVYLEKMDGVQLASLEVAQLKAGTAIRFKRPTKAMNDTLVGGGTHLLSLPNTLPIEGGLPIMVNGTPIGAIGVSGVTSAQDGIIAAAGVSALAP
jgi:glc operon protein GlcG